MSDLLAIGEVYGGHVRVGSAWRRERRELVDVSELEAVYRVMLDPTEGTCVDAEQPLEVVSLKAWLKWASR